MPTCPGVNGTKSRTDRLAVSYRRRVTRPRVTAGSDHPCARRRPYTLSPVATETAQTLDRGLRLLHLVADAPAGLTVTEAASRLGVGRAVVYRLATTLGEHGMIRRDSGGRLRLGAGVLHLARRAQPLVADAALPSLRRLAEEVGATAHLTIAEGG